MRKLALGVALILALFAASAALAAYTGPQRGTHQVCGAPHNLFDVSYGQHRYVCSYKIKCGDRPDQGLRCPRDVCDDLAAGLPYLRVEDSCHDEQDPPATVNASVQCAGGGGWCRDSAVVAIQGSEPVSGYAIVGIEGTLDGATFACNTAQCNVPVSGGGSHHLTYWALSSYGDTSLMGQTDVRIDAENPSITWQLPAPDGNNGWYRHAPVSLNAQAGDPTSGVASLEGALDGGAWQAAPLTLNAEGLHTVAFRAADVAGHVVVQQRQVGLDVTPPTVQAVFPAANGQNGWYLGPVTVQVQAEDAVSGIAAAQAALDGGGWQNGQVTVPEGDHTVTVRAEDGAGWESRAQVRIRVDAHPPENTLNGAGGAVSCVAALAGRVSDAVSGLAGAALRVDGGAWESLRVGRDGA